MESMTRRKLMVAGAATAGACALAANPIQAADEAPVFKTKLRKALIQKLPDEKSLTPLKEAGFDGVECSDWSAAPEKAEEARKVADRLGMKIHSVLRGWTQFNDATKTAADIASVETALRTSQILGADALLLVPCRIGDKTMAMPKPKEFRFEFDAKTGHVSKVVEGDNKPYEAYIQAHNQAVDASRAAMEKLIPAAEKTGVVIAHENVWNNLWVKPDLLANFIGSFKSKWIQCYFDIGNHVKYAPAEEWIAALGKLIVKCHVKDFKLNDDPGGNGAFVDIRDGSVNWPVVRAALEKIGYSGWMTIEGGKLSVAEHGKRLDMIIAGK
ncbi:MAG: sugar phosphate isomerase/epimerase [Candidatus Sumerlaeota bacterium]|nr:sugar phosphate isomerase/epimerase [Candidatus Sumerlaeota bacterium]